MRIVRIVQSNFRVLLPFEIVWKLECLNTKIENQDAKLVCYTVSPKKWCDVSSTSKNIAPFFLGHPVYLRSLVFLVLYFPVQYSLCKVYGKTEIDSFFWKWWQWDQFHLPPLYLVSVYLVKTVSSQLPGVIWRKHSQHFCVTWQSNKNNWVTQEKSNQSGLSLMYSVPRIPLQIYLEKTFIVKSQDHIFRTPSYRQPCSF